MDSDQKVFVDIYCMIYNDSFNWEFAERLVTGRQIFDFLMEDACYCFDENGNLIPGDLNLWYLGCTDKFGWLAVEDQQWEWEEGESSFDIVEEFAMALYNLDLITEQQYRVLKDKIKEGRAIGDMYCIGDYLISRKNTEPEAPSLDSKKVVDSVKTMISQAEKAFLYKGFQSYRPEKGGTHAL